MTTDELRAAIGHAITGVLDAVTTYAAGQVTLAVTPPEAAGEPGVVTMSRRPMPDRLRYFAAKLSDGDVPPDIIANALEMTANELDANAEPAPITRAEIDQALGAHGVHAPELAGALADLFTRCQPIHPGGEPEAVVQITGELR